MTASALPPFRLAQTNREVIIDRIRHLPDGWMVRCGPPNRSSDQNRIFHAIVDDFAKAIPTYAGVPMDAESWKSVLLVSFANEDRSGAVRLVPGLDGSGLVQVRESSARMSKARATALIDYCMAEAARLGVTLRAHD